MEKTMNTKKQQKKEIAINYLKKLDIYKPYIKGFKEEIRLDRLYFWMEDLHVFKEYWSKWL